MSKRYIAHRAWEYYRAIVAEYPDARTRATISACFRAAWKTPPSARAEWDALNAGDGAEALDALSRMVWHVKRRAETAGRPWAEWVQTADDARSAAGEAWARMPALLDRADAAGEDIPLAIILYRAAAAAVRWIYRAEHAGINADTYDPEFGRRNTAAETVDPEQAAIIHDAINRAMLTDEDRVIIAAIVRGNTVRQIAQMISSSKSTVQRRLDAIRARLKEDLAIQKGAI